MRYPWTVDGEDTNAAYAKWFRTFLCEKTRTTGHVFIGKRTTFTVGREGLPDCQKPARAGPRGRTCVTFDPTQSRNWQDQEGESMASSGSCRLGRANSGRALIAFRNCRTRFRTRRLTSWARHSGRQVGGSRDTPGDPRQGRQGGASGRAPLPARH